MPLQLGFVDKNILFIRYILSNLQRFTEKFTRHLDQYSNYFHHKNHYQNGQNLPHFLSHTQQNLCAN